MIPLREARTELRDADVLLFRRQGLIARAGRGVHSHAAMLAWWDDEPFCLETRLLAGGRAVTLHSQVQCRPGRIDWFQTDAGGRWPELDRRGAVRAMRRWAGRPYGLRGLLAVALRHVPLARWLLAVQVDDARADGQLPFCSHAVAAALREGGGVDPVPYLADRWTEPADLARSPLFRYRGTLSAH